MAPAAAYCFVVLSALSTATTAFVSPHRSLRDGSAISVSLSPEDALAETRARLEKMRRQHPRREGSIAQDEEYGDLYVSFIQQPANSLKILLKERGLKTSGRKPDLAARLVESELEITRGYKSEIEEDASLGRNANDSVLFSGKVLTKFCGMDLSSAASRALGQAGFERATSIQRKAIPRLVGGESLILHAETGSGKTLAYLLPITEWLWRDPEGDSFALVLTPTRELAAQVAGVASVLAPPGSVRLVTHPSNLMSRQIALKERGELENGGYIDDTSQVDSRLIIGSAKSIMTSLYGSKELPASPTRKPQAMALLQSTRWLVMDEFDRLLNVKSKGGSTSPSGRSHEKPAAIVAAAVARMTLGRAQTVAASATVGRTMRREMARVLGLAPQDCPDVVQGGDNASTQQSQQGVHVERAVTIPSTVTNYVTTVDTTSVGKLLTSAYFVVKNINEKVPRRTLLVLSNKCGIDPNTAVGAFKHFRCKPEPMTLLDALEAKGADYLIEKHRKVTRATGVGQSMNDEDAQQQEEGYLLVTGEDSVRGLHLDGLDFVVVVGRAKGPDEYTHIAGRTGRAGRLGHVINVLGADQAAAMKGWEKMLSVGFKPLAMEDIPNLE